MHRGVSKTVKRNKEWHDSSAVIRQHEEDYVNDNG